MPVRWTRRPDLSRVGRILRGGLAVATGLAALAWLAGGTGTTRIDDRPLAALDVGADRPLRIVAFGTSLTAGNAWPDVLAETLRSCLDRPVDMRRVARAGAGSAWGLAQVGRVAALRPDLVLIEFAINDANLRDGVWPWQGRATHDRMLAALKQDLPEAQLLLMTMNPVRGVHRVLRAGLGIHYRSYDGLARTHDTGLAVLSRQWADAALPSGSIPDGLHPGDAATRAVVVPHLARMIAGAMGRDDCPDPAARDISR